MKRYISHKEVDAAYIIGESTISESESIVLIFGEKGSAEITGDKIVSRDWYKKHSENEWLARSLIGGYFVRYADGYESWSPAEAFESGYKEIGEDGNEALKIDSVTEVLGEKFNFSAALAVLNEGKKVAREGWNGKGMHIELQVPTDTSKMTLPYIFMKTAQGDLVPWLASQTDLLANDWVIVE